MSTDDGLSRFVDLSRPDSDGYPADIARFGLAAAGDPEPAIYDGPDGPVALPCFDVGLVLAGAISAGAYTAGVLDYLIEVLDDWEVAKEDAAHQFGSDFARWPVPPHAIRIRAVAGASAGSVCSALLALAVQRRFLPVKGMPGNIAGPDADRTDNPFYDLWVNRLDIAGMLETDDLGADVTLATLPSLLNSKRLAEAAASALDTPGPQPEGRRFPARRRYLADPLPVALSVANLDGVPFCYRFDGLEGARFATMRHADALRFLVHAQSPALPPEEAPGGYLSVTGPPTADAGINPGGAAAWRALADSAVGSGAFPVAFAPLRLRKDPDAYRFDLKQRTDLAPENPDAWLQPARMSAGFSTVMGGMAGSFDTVDGGTMNNQPFQFARSILTGPLGRMESRGHLARKALLIIDPFPAAPPDPVREGRVESHRGGNGRLGLAGALPRLARAWINQARYDANDLGLAASSDEYSRFMLSPLRARAAPAPGALGDTALGQAAIASGAMGGFAGFLDRRYRHHDFLLGRRNAENFLRNYFALPAGNPLFDENWWSGRMGQARVRFETLTAEAGDAHERLIVPPLQAEAMATLAHADRDRQHADETRRKLFVRRSLVEPSAIWPGDERVRPFNPDSIAHLVEERVDAILKIAARDIFGATLSRLLAWPRRAITKRIAAGALDAIRNGIADHGLRDPKG
ncbi:hypothetical protein ACUJ46_06480 [Sandaracinobacteroides sp. A072]|uniref:hypothetical protein n=1 Tax=Sandaracinobacteroides sp. A072 TaxID=3461146 RepID=UPI0040415EAD